MSDEQAVTVSDDGLLALITVQAGEIERLRAENEKLRAALKPFADIAAQFEFADDNEGISGVLLGHLRAAAAALKETGDE